MGVEDYNKQQMERLQEHKIAFDQEAMWAAMQKKRKRRGAFFFLTMALVALAIVFLSCGLYSWYKGENTWFNSDNSNISQLSNKTNTADKEQNIIDVSELATPESSSDRTTNSPAGNTKISDSTQSDKLTDETVTSISKNSSNLAKADINPRESIKRNLASIYDNSSDLASRNIDNKGDDILMKGSNSEGSEKSIMLSNISLENRILNNQVIDSSSESKVSTSSLINIQPLEGVELSYLESLNNVKVSGEELEITAPVITEILKETKSRFHIGVYGGAGYLFRQSSIENDTSSAAIETLEEISLGLELKYQLSPNFFVRSGIEYWHATDRKESSSVTTFSVDNIKDLEELPNGFTADDNGIIITSYYSKIHTIYQSYNVPVLLGWNTNNTKWNLFAEAGLLYNFKTERRWDESVENLEVNRYNVGTQNQISPIAGIGLSFSPINNVELFARSNWRGSQFVTQNETSSTLKFGAVRAQVGIRLGL